MQQVALPVSSFLRGLHVVVTGGRHYDDADFVAYILGQIHQRFPIARLADGQCYLGGADDLAHAWATNQGIPERPRYPVSPHLDGGYGGGRRRNERMLLAERPDLVVAFPGGGGTANCYNRARSFGFIAWDSARGWDAKARVWNPATLDPFPTDQLRDVLSRSR